MKYVAFQEYGWHIFCGEIKENERFITFDRKKIENLYGGTVYASRISRYGVRMFDTAREAAAYVSAKLAEEAADLRARAGDREKESRELEALALLPEEPKP